MFCTVGGQPISAHPSVSFRSAATDLRYKMPNGCFRLGADIHLEPISGSFRRQSGITDIQPGCLKADIDYQKYAPTNVRVSASARQDVRSLRL